MLPLIRIPEPPFSEKEQNLLIVRKPELIKEWDFDENKNIDINTVSFACHKKVHWICSSNHKYEAMISNRTKKKPSGCMICYHNSQRKLDLEKVNAIREKHKETKNKINPTAVGDETELFVENLLKDTGKFLSVEKIGDIGGKADIKITQFDGKINYIQVKTLSKTPKRKDSYYMTNKIYSDDMLLVMVNKERDRFAVDFAKNLKKRIIPLSYLNKKSEYKDIMYTDLKNFVDKVVDLIPNSCRENQIEEKNKLENNMMTLLEEFCRENGLEYRKKDSNGNSIDGYINGLSFQAKHTSSNSQKNTYNVTFSKSSGSLDKKRIKRPYDEGDFDFTIIAIRSLNNLNKYQTDFCFIPSKVLISRKVIANQDNKGKTHFCICPPDYEKSHWSKEYWNNLSFLKEN